MSVLEDITGGWNTNKTPSNTDSEGNPPQAGSVAKQVVSEYDAAAGNNATVKGIIPTTNADGTINTAENQPVYNVKEDANKYNFVNQAAQPPSTPVTQPDQPTYTSPVDNFIKNYTPESEQQRGLREERERRNKLFTSIADGISSIANIAGAAGGAKNANPNNVSLTKAYQNRLDQLKQARKENEQKYLYYMQKKDEAKRQADAAAWDRAKFIADQNYKESESMRDQGNKDREYDRNVNNDKSNSYFKKLDANFKEKQFNESSRHNRATESLSAESNQISREKGTQDKNPILTGPNVGQGVTQKNAKSIVIPNRDGTSGTYYYNRNLDQALVGHKQEMIQTAQRLAQGPNGRVYRDIYNQLRNARTHDETLNVIVSNLSKFPQMSDAVKKTLGIGSSTGFNIESYKAHKANGTSKKTTKPPLE